MLFSVDAALEKILAAIPPVSAETVKIADAAGRVLAEPLTAAIDQPPFPSSAMDGYAVRAAEIHDGAKLEMIGASQAGRRFDGTMGPGQCVRIFTGAPVPDGADAVVMQELTESEGSTVAFRTEIEVGRNIRARANDFGIGDELAPAGTFVTPAITALIAAANRDAVAIARQPTIALMATGDELVLPGAPLGPDQIIASNSFGLEALFAPWSAQIIDHGVIGDDRNELRAALAKALADQPDILITIGGASVGEHDFVQDELVANGVDIDFWRIAMRPGKPLMFGRKENTLVFGLPGNPVSALVTSHILVLPAVMTMSGARPPVPLRLPLADALPANGPRRHFIRAHLVHSTEHPTRVTPIGQTDSGHLSSLSRSDCLIVQTEHCAGKNRGELVEVILL